MNHSKFFIHILGSFLVFFTISCVEADLQTNRQVQKIDLIYDTDANNEVDDQHALALEKEPAIAGNVRIFWLGSNYPRTGEHNKVWDKESMNYILDQDVEFEFVTVRYGDPSGTDAVKVTQAQIMHRMPGLGPEISEPVVGRHGGEFKNWGDYSPNLQIHPTSATVDPSQNR